MRILSAWQLFHYGITHRSFYILGAGASMPNINFDVDRMVNKIITLDSYEVMQQPSTSLSTRLFPIKTYSSDQLFLKQNLIKRTLEPIKLALLAQQLTHKYCQIPPQYKVFDFFYSSLMFIFNVDNLSDNLHRRHIKFHPHGYVNTGYVQSELVNEIIQGNIDVPMCKLNTFYPPLPESADIILQESYKKLSKGFQSVKVVILIGYSFGLQSSSGEIDDLKSFEFLMTLLLKFPKPVLVIDPNPQLLIDRIEFSIKKNCLFFLPYKWDVLSRFILSGNFSHLSPGLYKVDYNYLKYSAVYETKKLSGANDFHCSMYW